MRFFGAFTIWQTGVIRAANLFEVQVVGAVGWGTSWLDKAHLTHLALCLPDGRSHPNSHCILFVSRKARTGSVSFAFSDAALPRPPSLFGNNHSGPCGLALQPSSCLPFRKCNTRQRLFWQLPAWSRNPPKEENIRWTLSLPVSLAAAGPQNTKFIPIRTPDSLCKPHRQTW